MTTRIYTPAPAVAATKEPRTSVPFTLERTAGGGVAFLVEGQPWLTIRPLPTIRLDGAKMLPSDKALILQTMVEAFEKLTGSKVTFPTEAPAKPRVTLAKVKTLESPIYETEPAQPTQSSWSKGDQAKYIGGDRRLEHGTTYDVFAVHHGKGGSELEVAYNERLIKGSFRAWAFQRVPREETDLRSMAKSQSFGEVLNRPPRYRWPAGTRVVCTTRPNELICEGYTYIVTEHHDWGVRLAYQNGDTVLGCFGSSHFKEIPS